MTDKGNGYTAYFIDMKSLTYARGSRSRTRWQHDLTIIRPDNLSPGPAVLANFGKATARHQRKHRMTWCRLPESNQCAGDKPVAGSGQNR